MSFSVRSSSRVKKLMATPFLPNRPPRPILIEGVKEESERGREGEGRWKRERGRKGGRGREKGKEGQRGEEGRENGFVSIFTQYV